MRRHRVKRTSRKPNFFWQGVLILAPMLVLAKLGALALTQDRRSAEREAQARAQEIADEVVEAIRVELEKPADGWGFRTDTAGQLVHPKPYESTLHPQPLDLAVLTEQQRGWWATGQAAANRPTRYNLELVTQGVKAMDFLLASKPPTNVAVAAHFIAGRLLLSHPQANHAEAEPYFLAILSNYPSAMLESGLPAQPLAQLGAFEVVRYGSQKVMAANNAFNAVLNNPNLLTGYLLQQMWTVTNRHLDWSNLQNPIPENRRRKLELDHAEVFTLHEAALQTWQQHELLRRLHSLSQTHSAGGAEFRPPPIARLGNGAPLLARAERWQWLAVPTNEVPPSVLASFVKSSSQPARESDETLAPPSLRRFGTSLHWLKQNADLRPLPSFEAYSSALGLWLLVRTPDEAGSVVACHHVIKLRELVDAALRRARMPAYLDASIRLAGGDIRSTNELRVLLRSGGAKGAGTYWRWDVPSSPPRALASATHTERGRALLAVNLHLVSPEFLFAQQEERAMLFKLLIGASALASVVGFLTAWRAFRKQLRLAEMKSNFVSSVSHELRAPIASVRLMAEGLERGKISDPAKQREYFHFISQECRRLSAMIENVLDFARIEQGRKEYEFEPTDVSALVETTVKLMEPYAEERGVRLRVESGELRAGTAASASGQATDATEAGCASPSPWGEGRGEGEQRVANLDGQAMQQALVNLLDNAIKHSPSGNEVVVALEIPNPKSSIQNPKLLLSVSDRGPGISAAEHEKIFERFYRLGSELRRETPGVGIGLSIVKHIVEAHSGRVRVESEVGKGSCFTIELPFAAEAQRRREVEGEA